MGSPLQARKMPLPDTESAGALARAAQPPNSLPPEAQTEPAAPAFPHGGLDEDRD